MSKKASKLKRISDFRLTDDPAVVLICDASYMLFASNDEQTHDKTDGQKHNSDAALVPAEDAVQEVITLSECQYCLKYVTNMDLHVKLHETPIAGVIKCLYSKCCEASFFSSMSLVNHMLEHQNELENYCLECGQFFDSPLKLEYHVLWHSKVRPFACDVPNCFFSSKSHVDLLSHQKSVHGDAVECPHCGKFIEYLHDYVSHVTKHKLGTPGVVKCIFGNCRLFFPSNADLKKHVAEKHSTLDKHFACRVPGCSFSSKFFDDHQAHERNSHSYKELKCRLCGVLVLQLERFRAHMKKHRSGKKGAIKCARSGCGRTFCSVADLTQHVQSFNHKKNAQHRTLRSQKVSLRCDVCAEDFKSFEIISLHIQTHLEKSPDPKHYLPTSKALIASNHKLPKITKVDETKIEVIVID